ncbi:MAG: sigma-70 family RNA polymerase sigma factor [Acidobacteriaceae bacterium]|nr:sigma-70 family RNA polymerase sigma factor [Acidobacteriaceae bacterium]
MPPSALETLLERRERFLGFIARRVSNHELAEDILQAAYMRALEKAPTGTDQESIVAWFFSVLRHAIIDHYRRRHTEAAAMERLLFELGPDEPVVADSSARRFVCGCIERVLPSLRPAYAELLSEVDLAETPLTQFALAHNLTPGNAAVRAHRARAALRRELAKTCGSCSIHACLDCVCKQPLPALGV